VGAVLKKIIFEGVLKIEKNICKYSKKNEKHP
jgi:hypothetical protein